MLHIQPPCANTSSLPPPAPPPPAPPPPAPLVGITHSPTVAFIEVHCSPSGQPLPSVPRQPATHTFDSHTMPLLVSPHSLSRWQSLSSVLSFGSRSLTLTSPSWFTSSVPSLTPPSSVSASSISVVVAPLSASGVHRFLVVSVSGSSQVLPNSVPSKRPSPSLSSSMMFDLVSPSRSSLGFGSSPSRTPSSSLSPSLGSLLSVTSSASLSPSPSESTMLSSSLLLGFVSSVSVIPLRLGSSEPSFTPPKSVSGLIGDVLLSPPSPSATQ